MYEGGDAPTSSSTVATASAVTEEPKHFFSRADTMNFMAAIGSDFKAGFVDPAPLSNADVGHDSRTLLGIEIPKRGKLVGRVLTEAMLGGTMPKYVAKVMRSAPAKGGLTTVLNQVVGNTRYFDAAGFPERSVGLTPGSSTAREAMASR